MRFLIIISVVIFLSSCEKYIDMEIPDNGRKMVANCLYSDTGNVTLNLTLSRFILDDAPYNPLSGATVELYEDNNFVGLLTETNQGIYSFTGFTPNPGSNHKIIISKDGVALTAYSYLPDIQSISFFDTSRVQRDYYEYLRFRFSINDPADTENFYMIGFTIKEQWTEENSEIYSIYFLTDEPAIEEYVMDGYGIFSDESFSGQTKFMDFDLELYNFPSDTNILYVNFLSISKDMYMYIKTMNAQRANDSPFSEPVMVYTNIVNGFGIFGGYSIYKDSILVFGPLAEGYIVE